MENNEPTLLELNEGVSNGWMQPRPHDGDALPRLAAAELKAKLHAIVATHVGPGTYEIRA